MKMNQSMPGTAKRGFTLIELLVVIAIIAILAAILFPAFARARENARRASCQSNMKQLGLGMIQYTQDYDEKFPMWGGGDTGWGVTVQPYIKSVQLLQCPSENTPPDIYAWNPGYSDYAINMVVGYEGGSRGLSIAALTQPSLGVLFVESGPVNASSYAQGCNISGSVSNCTTAGLAVLEAASNRHLDGSNIAYTDGHVKWSRMTGITLTNIYNMATPLSTSGGNGTFNLSP